MHPAPAADRQILESPNRLLAGLGRAERERLAPHLEPVLLRARQVLHWRADRVEHLHFIEDGLVSMLAQTGPHEEVEVWLAGREGLVGMPLLLGGSTAFYRRVVQVGGRALRLPAGEFRRACDEMPSIHAYLLRYAQAVLLQTAQNAACVTRHSVEQRVARWLAHAQDGLGRDVLPLTHALLARLIGVRRSSVTQAVGRLEQAGLLKQEWSRITVCEPERLRHAACGCYRTIRLASDAIIGEHAPGPARMVAD